MAGLVWTVGLDRLQLSGVANVVIAEIDRFDPQAGTQAADDAPAIGRATA
jgi:hypothetical protein